MLKYHFRNFNLIQGENVGELITRLCHLTADMHNINILPVDGDFIDILKISLAPYATYLMVVT